MNEDDRERFVWEYLRSHPDRARGIDGLAPGYAQRCRNR